MSPRAKTDQTMVKLGPVLSDAEACALAQFVKRIGWAEIRQNAASDHEARLMISALDHVRADLADNGYAPR